MLASLIHISDLLQQWEHVVRDPNELPGANDRFLALAELDPGGTVARLLDHPWLTSENLGTVATSGDKTAKHEQLEAFMSGLQLTEPLPQTLAQLKEGQRDHREEFYTDPLGGHARQEFGGDWLAAFARIGKRDWIAIVQERRDTAIEPVKKVNAIFSDAGEVAIAVFGVLLAILWYFLNRASSSQ